MTVYILSFFISIYGVATFYFGLKVGQGYKPMPEVKRAVKRIFKPPRKETPEEIKARAIYENIENFGTNIPQKEVV